ncbi:hypothetical protein FE257_010096 [Aspergillus nanangensis]|uniref:Amidohydrolase-related domain-containing protein n=1 Tax=Aspergillus nanangensis TaxID=2582783 RepID=A0AAD4GTK3_ASPNN|nr:hypothetical protein FE257_010096 [Aspergillus nanangensis]
MDPHQQPTLTANILISHTGHISYIGPNTPPPSDVETTIDATGQWLLPGFISAHSHFWQSVFPGHAPSSTVTDWSPGIYNAGSQFTAQDFYTTTLQGAQSHLRKGITTAFNFTYSPRFREGQTDRAQFAGAAASGIRFIHGFNVGAVGAKWSIEQAQARAQTFLDWAEGESSRSCAGEDRYLGTMVAMHGVDYAHSASLYAEAEIMRRLQLQGHMHYLESSRPEDIAVERRRWTWLREAGLLLSSSLGHRLILGHFVHATDEMVKEAAQAGVRMSWNPLSNGRLGSGIADVPRYRRHGVCVGLGVDGEASSDRCDPFENMRMGLYSLRAKYQDPRVLATSDVLHMHTLGAAETLGVADRVGSLTVGKYADMLLLEPPKVWQVEDAMSAVVLAAGVEHVKKVFVGGVQVWAEGQGSVEAKSVVHDWPAWTF